MRRRRPPAATPTGGNIPTPRPRPTRPARSTWAASATPPERSLLRRLLGPGLHGRQRDEPARPLPRRAGLQPQYRASASSRISHVHHLRPDPAEPGFLPEQPGRVSRPNAPNGGDVTLIPLSPTASVRDRRRRHARRHPPPPAYNPPSTQPTGCRRSTTSTSSAARPTRPRAREAARTVTRRNPITTSSNSIPVGDAVR